VKWGGRTIVWGIHLGSERQGEKGGVGGVGGGGGGKRGGGGVVGDTFSGGSVFCGCGSMGGFAGFGFVVGGGECKNCVTKGSMEVHGLMNVIC